MSFDKPDKFLPPKWLKEWIDVLAKIGLPIAGTWGLLKACWQLTEGEVLVDKRLLLALCVAVPVGFSILAWYSMNRKPRGLTYADFLPRNLKLAPEEIGMLLYFARHDGLQIMPRDVAQYSGLSTVKFQHHWHRIHSVHKLVDYVSNSMGGLYMLSHKGRDYLVENQHVN